MADETQNEQQQPEQQQQQQPEQTTDHLRPTKGNNEPSTLPRATVAAHANQPAAEKTPAQRLADVEKFIAGYRKKHPYDQF